MTALSDHRPQRLVASGVDPVLPVTAAALETDGGDPGVDKVVETLIAEFPTASSEAVRAVVEAIAAGYRNARIGSYVAIFVERESRERLCSAGLPIYPTYLPASPARRAGQTHGFRSDTRPESDLRKSWW